MSDLAETVLPLIRTRADVWRWNIANDHGAQMQEAVAILEDAIEIPVQVNGKVRGRVSVPRNSSEEEIRAAAFAAVASYLAGMEIVKVVVPNGRLVSLVVRPKKS